MKKYLTNEETLETVNCLCCKYCLPPRMRENGNMCNLDKCKYEKDDARIKEITDLSMDEANKRLCYGEKRIWVHAKNDTANLYFINPQGKIQEVEPSGWWY